MCIVTIATNSGNIKKSFWIFTAHKRSCGKVIFLHLSVILFTGVHRGDVSQHASQVTWADPLGQTPHPGQTPSWTDTQPLAETPRADTPSPDGQWVECILVLFFPTHSKQPHLQIYWCDHFNTSFTDAMQWIIKKNCKIHTTRKKNFTFLSLS